MTDPELIESIALRIGMQSAMNQGSGSCVWTEGCNGVSQAHLMAFAEQIALHVFAALTERPCIAESQGGTV